MNKQIKELYNNMNEQELTKQYDYLVEYFASNFGKLTITELREINKQKRYIKSLMNSLLIYQVKKWELRND